ncbi:dnaJ homolog subfamily C member 17-like [Lineus longissimus]|uniref:dnaJ homolog subfamily C member 17-like n=1 Tax=Lineus longissimus TaxID=88925 RepID=UPI002B4F8F4F
MADLANKNLYATLEVSEDATEKEIVKAYRKKALKCHPDKNPDNPKAADLFHELSKALEVLTDAAAKAAYDKIRAAQKKAAERTRALDSKRRRLKEDLEAKESASQSGQQVRTVPDKTAAERLQAEIERLQKEGSRILEQEQEYMKEELKRKDESTIELEEDGDEDVTPKLRVKWKCRKDDPTNGGYSHDFLRKAFSKYGKVTNLLVSSKKNGSALVEFASSACAQSAYLHEVGLPNNPVTIIFLQGQPTQKTPAKRRNESPTHLPGASSGVDDFEQAVLMRMRQAQQAREKDGIQEPSRTHLPCEPEDFEASVLKRLHQAQQTSTASQSAGLLIHPPKPAQKPIKPPTAVEFRDFESVADMQARRAAERKRLIEQIQSEDD